MANGIADNMLITTYLSCKAPVFVAPAMDLDMYSHPSTQANLDKLRSYGNHIIEPASGELASGLYGKGRMEEPEEIVRYIDNYFDKQKPFKGKRILITAGPTYEKIDPVRFIGNYSSGKMGLAIAEILATKGADITLIAGPVGLKTSHPHIDRIDVESAVEMYERAVLEFESCDAAILCAAVADYRPAEIADKKIKREENTTMTLKLEENPDIAAALGRLKKPHQILAGFALETDCERENAIKKMRKKNFDFIVVNSLQDEGAGFRTDTNKITIINSNGQESSYPLKQKMEVAIDIADYLKEMMVTSKNSNLCVTLSRQNAHLP
jgi:phosphopantothenoylcysteine decarboxylase/phosphopantothenate--cysteine ligase